MIYFECGAVIYVFSLPHFACSERLVTGIIVETGNEFHLNPRFLPFSAALNP